MWSVCNVKRLWCSHLRFIFYSGYEHGIWLRVSVIIPHNAAMCIYVDVSVSNLKLAFSFVVVVVISLFAIRPDGECELCSRFNWTGSYSRVVFTL